jgi:hypothetical protein
MGLEDPLVQGRRARACAKSCTGSCSLCAQLACKGALPVFMPSAALFHVRASAIRVRRRPSLGPCSSYLNMKSRGTHFLRASRQLTPWLSRLPVGASNFARQSHDELNFHTPAKAATASSREWNAR